MNHPLVRNPSGSTSGEGSTSNAGSGVGGHSSSIGNNGIVQGDNGEGFEVCAETYWDSRRRLLEPSAWNPTAAECRLTYFTVHEAKEMAPALVERACRVDRLLFGTDKH
jgi:hypothetical protein